MDTRMHTENRAPGNQGDAWHPAPETLNAASNDVAKLPVRAVMTTRVLVTGPDDDILLAWELMIHAGIRHLPVIDGTRLIA
jgi:CBS domain-containing protein